MYVIVIFYVHHTTLTLYVASPHVLVYQALYLQVMAHTSRARLSDRLTRVLTRQTVLILFDGAGARTLTPHVFRAMVFV